MSTQIEKLEHNMVKLTIEVAADVFAEATRKAYQKNKARIQVPGFRKGKAPQQLIEKMYGAAVFFEDAANEVINDTYPAESASTELEFMSRPEFDVEQIEKGKPFIYTAVVAVRPEVELGDYMGLEVRKAEIAVTDEEVENEIKREQEKNSRLVDVEDRAVEAGDTVTLDYAGTVDGVAFDGGTAEGQTLEIGSNSFIPGFEDQLIGLNAGESKDVNVTFPAEYHAEDLAGKDAVFACTIHRIQKKELPELDDEFAQDVSEFDTFADYKDSVRAKLLESREKAARSARENEAVDKLIEASVMDIPDAMVDAQAEQMYNDQARQLQSQGIPIDMYLKYMGIDAAGFMANLKPQALKQIQTRLVLEEVVKKENIEISEEKVEEEIDRMAEAYRMEPEKFREVIGDNERSQMKQDLAVQEAITLIADNAKEV